MQPARFVPLPLGLIAALAACATGPAGGYRASPEYAAYAGASCADAAFTQIVHEATEHYLERETGYDIKGYGPGGQDMFFGLAAAFFTALGEGRPPGLADACDGARAAQAASSRHARYPY